MTTYLYDSIPVFSGIASSPLYARSHEMIQVGERWAALNRITLLGQLTGKCFTFENFITGQNQLLSGFRKDYKTLDIYETGLLIASFPHVKVESINFPSDRYVGLVPFEIELTSYPQEYFTGSFGVLNPRDEFDLSEDEEGILTVSHTVGGQGFCNDGNITNAVSNIKNWVSARTGWSGQVTSSFINGLSSQMCLVNAKENLDRLNATYEITEVYKSDKYASGQLGVLRYTSDFNSGIENGISTITIQGNLKGCKNQTISGLRDRYNGFNIFNEAINEFQKITARVDLNSFPVSRTFGEDQTHKVINFSFTYDDDLRPEFNIVYSTKFEYDYENDIISCSISAEISIRSIYILNSWDSLKAFANTVNLYPIAQAAYQEYAGSIAPHLLIFPLNNNQQTYSRNENEYELKITLSSSFNNEEIPPYGFRKLDRSLSFIPAITQYTANPILNQKGDYYITDLGFINRGLLSIQLNGIVNTNLINLTVGTDSLRAQCLGLQNDYLLGTKKVLENQTLTTGNANNGGTIIMDTTYSAEQTEFLV